MKAFTLVVMVAVTAGVSNAVIDPAALINLKAQIGHYLVNKAAAALTAKQNLILSGTAAVLSAKQDLIQKQIPHLFALKANTVNSLVQLKTHLLSNKAAQLGHIISPAGGDVPSDVPTGPYQPPAELIPASEPVAPGHEGPALEVLSTPQEPPPAELTQQVTPIVRPPPPLCTTCEQSTSGLIQIPPQPPTHVQPAPPVRPPQAIYGPPLRPQPIYGPPAPPLPPPPPPQLPVSYGPPANHKPASTYGPPAPY